MKLSLVTETYPPEVNGVAMTLCRLVNGIAASGTEVTVIRPRQKTDEEPAVFSDASEDRTYAEWLTPGAALPRYEGLMMGFPVLGRLTNGWARKRPDVVHIATEGPLGWSALGAAVKLGIPVSTSFHTNFHQYGTHYGFGAFKEIAIGYLRSFHNQAAITMVPTRQAKRQLEDDGFQNVEVLSRGVDASLFSPERRSGELRRSWSVGPADSVYLYVGRLAREKNIDLAVRSFLHVREKNPNAHFVLVGDGPERAALEKRYPDFHFAGMRTGVDLATHYASGDVFLFPSITETFGNVVTEAIASGLVVVTYDYAAGREHIAHGLNGFLAPFDDDAAFCRAVLDAASRKNEWPGVRTAARENALTITWESIFARFGHLLGGVANTAVRERNEV